MNKKFSVLTIAVLLILVMTNCFAQITDKRIMALQGEWVCVKIQDEESNVYDFTESPYIDIVNIWKFEGNNFSSVTKNIQTGTNEIETATFTIVGESLVISSIEKSDAYSYTLKDNILTVIVEGCIFTLRKR